MKLPGKTEGSRTGSSIGFYFYAYQVKTVNQSIEFEEIWKQCVDATFLSNLPMPM
jgi:hypothetical protein